ncbi:MAG: hypothetical protein U0931_10515 [Vulcanimicrobiota bacterium]
MHVSRKHLNSLLARIVLVSLLCFQASAQHRLEELAEAEHGLFAKSLRAKAFPGHDEDIIFSHKIRLLKVNGKVHALALHQANMHSGNFSWTHYVWDGQQWRARGPGLPDPAAGDVGLVLPEPTADGIQAHFKQLVKGLALEQWPVQAQKRLLDPEKLREI